MWGWFVLVGSFGLFGFVMDCCRACLQTDRARGRPGGEWVVSFQQEHGERVAVEFERASERCVCVSSVVANRQGERARERILHEYII